MTLCCMSPIIRWFTTLFIPRKKATYSYIHWIIYITFKALQRKFTFMPEFWDKLITFIEQNIRTCSWNKKLLTNASIALSWFANTFLRFHTNIPINKINNISLFQFPYILGQFSVLFKMYTKIYNSLQEKLIN